MLFDEINTSKKDMRTIRSIVLKFIARFPEAEKINWTMDLMACHHTNPLRLEELLQTDDLNFFHDILGINQNINRTTGELENCFIPRYSVPEKK